MATNALYLKSNTSYWPELDGIRSLAFLLVYISHVGAFPGFSIAFLSPLVDSYNLLVKWGWIGVDLFLVLSGFLITSLLLQERSNFGNISFKFFFIRRMLRIWPLYYLVFILGFFVLPFFNWMGIGYGTATRQEMVNTYFTAFFFFFGNLQFAHVIKCISPMIASLWTACLEEQFYVIWGSVLTVLNNQRRLLVTIISLLSLAIATRFYIQTYSTSHNAYYYNTLSHMDPLLMGALSAIGWNSFEKKIKQWGPILFVFSISAIIFIMVFTPDIFQNKKSIVWAMTVIALSWTSFLLSIMSIPFLKRMFSLKPFTAMGKITYGMYLLHYPILVTSSGFLNQHSSHLNPLQKWCSIFFFTLFSTLAVASCSWKFYERPFNTLRHKFSRKNKESELQQILLASRGS